jgi:hypothetical protein
VVVVDREEGQYLGHVTTVLLEDGRTMLAVYPKGHGKGAIVLKRSSDGGRTWSARLPTPGNWATYGYWDAGKPPYIVSVRLTLADLDREKSSSNKPSSGVVSRNDPRG